MVAGLALLAALVLASLLLQSCGCQQSPPATSVPTTEPSETQGVLDTDVKTLEQLQELMTMEEDLQIDLNVDLEVPEAIKVVGNKTITGTGKLTAVLGGRDTYSIFDVQARANLVIDGLSLDGNASADGITIRETGTAEVRNVSIAWPYQYGVAAHGDTRLENVTVDNAPTAAVLASYGTVMVDGGSFTNSHSLAMYVEKDGVLKLTGDPVLEKSSKHGITNRGVLEMDSGSITGCTQYAIVNYGKLTAAYAGQEADGAIRLSGNGKGGLYNYPSGVITASGLEFADNEKSAVSNSGVMDLKDSLIENSGTNGIYNAGSFTGKDLTVGSSANCGIYNVKPGDLKLTDSTIQDSVKRGVHNKGGIVNLSTVQIKTCGTHGIANTVDDFGTPGTLVADKVTVSGAKTNLYNEGAGVTTTVTDCVFEKSNRTNVVVSYGTLTMRNTKVLGSRESGTCCVNVAKGASAKVSGCTISGGAKQGFVNHGTATVTGGSITGNAEYAIVNDGKLTVGGSGQMKLGSNGKGAIYNYEKGTVVARQLQIYSSGASAISNNGTMTLSDSKISVSGTNGIYNTGSFTGKALTVNSSDNCGVYNLYPGKLTLSGSVITNSTKRGVHNAGATATLTDVTVDTCGTHGVANTVDKNGNPGTVNAKSITVCNTTTNVYNEGAGVKTTVTGSTLKSSRRTNVVVTYGTMTLDGTQILGSQEEGTYCLQIAKGAVCTVAGNGIITGSASRGVTNHGTLTISGGRIYGNRSTASGGGVFTDGTLYVTGGSIYNNTANSAGGGICVSYSSNDPELIGKLYMTGGEIYGNTTGGNGGGIYVSKGLTQADDSVLYCYASVTGGTIRNNKAQKGTAIMYSASGAFGGQVSIGSESDVCLNKGVVLEVTELTKHSASKPVKVSAAGAAGTVIMEAESEAAAQAVCKALVSTSTSVGFLADGKQIVTNVGEYVTVEGLDLSGADVKTVTDFQKLKEAVESVASGKKRIVTVAKDITMEGTIDVPAGVTVLITDDGTARTLLRGTGMTSGSFFQIPEGAKLGLQGTGAEKLILDGNQANVTVTDENSSLLVNKGELHVIATVLRNNYADSAQLEDCFGGLVFAPSGVVNITDSVLTGGNAKNGGAIFINGAQVTVKNTEIADCAASASGGAIRLQGGMLVVEGGSFTGNTGSVGGAIALDNGVTLKLTGTRFEENATTGGHGGAVYATNSSVIEASGVTFKANHTEGNGSYYGGALGLNSDSRAVLTDCVFEKNYVDHEGNNHGGAIYAGKNTQVIISGTSEFKNNRVTGNGGAIYGNNNAQVTVGEDTTFVQNQAASGGAAYVTGYTLTIDHAVFRNNSATGSGGTLYAKPTSTPTKVTVTNSTFHENTCGGYGGVINVAGEGSTVSFADCTFTGNTAKAGNNANTLMVSGKSELQVKNITITPASSSVCDVRVNAAGVLKLAGKVELGTVYYGADTAKLHVLEALTAGSAIRIRPAAYEEGVTVLTAENDQLLAAAATYVSPVDPAGEDWSVDTDGKLVSNTKEAFIGTTGYETLAQAVAAAKPGDEIRLNTDLSANVTVPAGVTLNGNGKTLTGAVTVADTGKLKNMAVAGNVTLQGDTDLSTVTVSGKVSVPAGKVLTVGGSFDADTVALAEGATIHVAAPLAEGTSVNVTSVVQTQGTVILTGTLTEYTKFNLALSDGTLTLGASGKIEAVPFEAVVNGTSYSTLEEAIAGAEAGSTIRVTNHYTVTAQIEISKKLTITSASSTACTLSRGSATGAVFNIVAGGDLTLTNVILDGKNMAADKALVENAGSFTLSADAVVQNGNNTAQAGGLDNLDGGTAAVYGTFRGCTGKNGGAIRNYDGGTLDIADGALLENNESTANGGALHQSGIFTAGKATFRDNTSSGSYSGAIHVGSTGSTSLKGTVFVGNDTAGSGGVMYISGNGAATVENISVTGKTDDIGNAVQVADMGGAFLVGKNATLTVNGTENVFRDLLAASGGAIYNNGGTVTIAGGSFTGIASTGSGGVIYNKLNSGKGLVTINGGSFVNNRSGSVGGVINTSGAVTVTINGGSFTGNTAATNGGAIHVSGSGTLKVTAGTFTGNTDGNDPDVDVWLNNKSTSKLDLSEATAATVTFGLVSGADFAENTGITNPNGVPLSTP